MCGIFSYLGKRFTEKELVNFLLKNKHRGPDNTRSLKIGDLFLGFNRLQINGIDNKSNQPFSINGYYLICNGEIYNFKELKSKYKLEDEYVSNSDCEIILHLYNKIGIEETLNELDGVFAFVLYDERDDKIICVLCQNWRRLPGSECSSSRGPGGVKPCGKHCTSEKQE